MINEGKHSIGGPAMNKALVVDEAAKMPEEEGIYMLCAVGLVAANEGYFVWDSEPGVEIAHTIGHQGTSRV